MVAEVFFHKDFIGIDGTVHTPEWSFRGAVILPGGVKRVCSSVKSGVLLRNSPKKKAVGQAASPTPPARAYSSFPIRTSVAAESM